MTRNQKIALGCGGAGCLGLIVVAVAGGLIYFFAYRSSSARDANYNYNYNYNVNRNANRTTNETADDDSTNSSSSNSSTSTAQLTEDDKHRLFQAAAVTHDDELQRRVWVKIGIMDENFTTGEKYSQFVIQHTGWLVRNFEWVSEMDTPEEGRAYVNEHLD